MAASGGLTRSVTAAGTPAGSLLAWSPTLMWLGCFALLIVFGVFRVRAGASWQERTVRVEDLAALEVPDGIAAAARTLHRAVGGAELILGELIEDTVVLDPYLMLACNDQMVCLGIWDEARVIASAHRYVRPERAAGPDLLPVGTGTRCGTRWMITTPDGRSR
jgi:hypothetical protein